MTREQSITAQQMYEDYLKKVKENLKLIERQSVTSSDERLDITNKLLIQMLGLQSEAFRLQIPEDKPTKILTEKVIVVSGGTPVQFPKGKPVSEVRLSTADNTGTIYLGTSYVEAKDTKHRFAIVENHNITLPFKVSNLSEVWCDADTDADGVSIFAEVESND